MPETPTFVVNDRRKFTADGELRHEGSLTDTPGAPMTGISAEPERKGPQLVHTDDPTDQTQSPLALDNPTLRGELTDLPESAAFAADLGVMPPVDPGTLEVESQGTPELAIDDYSGDSLPPGSTAEESAEAARAYDATAERLELALRAADPGGERMPPMTFERLTQSLYTQALMLLGGGAQPGETPRIDILGARQTIDMLAILSQRTKGNLSGDEDKLLQSALFDLRMGFLEITQALARQAAQRQPGSSGPGAPGGFGGGAGPRIVR